MFIPIFWEVDNAGEPIYKDTFMRFYENAHEQDFHMIVSAEYAACIEDFDMSIGSIISDEIMTNIDDSLCEKGDRAKLLTVLKNEELERFLEGVIKNSLNIYGILTCGKYGIIDKIAARNNVEVYVISTALGQEVFDQVYIRFNDAERKIETLENQKVSMKSDIDSKNEYIQQLQIRVNSLEAEIYRNKQKQESYQIEVENVEKRLEKSDADKSLYLDLYRELLKELDRVKVELLNYKAKG